MIDTTGADSTAQLESSLPLGEDFRALVALLPIGVCCCEAPSGRITFFNEQAVHVWGITPRVGDIYSEFVAALRLMEPDGRPLSADRFPMTHALSAGVPCRDREMLIERPDGSRVAVIVNINPVRNPDGHVIGAISAFHEITALRKAEQAGAHLAAIVDSSDDAIVSKDLNGMIQSWNAGAERIFGYTADEAVGQPITIIIPAERLQEETQIITRLRRGERIEHFETVRVRKDGAPVDISLSISPVKGSDGTIVGAAKIARDITERKRMERLLGELQQRYAISLEEKVRRTSAELTQSQEKLRLAERMASLGTLAAGLGHDMGNILMPLRAYVDALAAELKHHGNGSGEYLESIRKAMEYLHTLAGGLRMLAIEPRLQQGVSQEVTIAEWWKDAEPILKTAVGRHVALEHEFEDDLPPIALPMHMLIQAVFNLVQNAAQAMAGPPPQSDGKVRVSAKRATNQIELSVADNGPGMTQEIRERCVEPYFTTKARGISTGMGLALVHGIMQSVNGSIEIESELGRGSTFTLRIPIADRPHRRVAATVDMKDQRQAALTRHLIQSLHLHAEDCSAEQNLFITDDSAAAEEFLKRRPGGRVVLFAESSFSSPSAALGRMIHVQPSAKTAEIRKALTSAIESQQ